jgi:hypothetical protein
MADTQAVVESRVQGTRVNQAGQSQLANPAKPLKKARPQQLSLFFPELQEIVNGIANSKTFGHALLVPFPAVPWFNLLPDFSDPDQDHSLANKVRIAFWPRLPWLLSVDLLNQ